MLHACYWRIIGKVDGVLKEDGVFRVREIFWEEKRGGRHHARGRKTFREARC